MVWITQEVQESYHLSKTCPLSQQYPAANAHSYLEHACALDINSKPLSMRLSGIICNIGPSCLDVGTIEKMITNGMNVASLNFAHGFQDFHAEAVNNIHSAVEMYSRKTGARCPLALALDVKGPLIRTGFPLGGRSVQVELKKGEIIKLTTDLEYVEKGTDEIMFVDYPNIDKIVQPGMKITIDDGNICLICVSLEKGLITCEIEKGGHLGSRRRIRLPGVEIDLPVLTKKDQINLMLGLELGVDIIFAPYIRSGEAVKEIRNILGEKGNNIAIIAKIENIQGVKNIDEIIKASDGVILVRSSLGVEISLEQMSVIQKSVIAKCNKVGKPVICTTQMLESMSKKPHPTRAEAGDVANAILDGVDCIMLQNETSRGDYPAECVLVVSKICKEAEAATWQNEIILNLPWTDVPPFDSAQSAAMVVAEISFKCRAKAIVTVTNSLKSGKLISKYKPPCPIVAVTRNITAAKQAHLYRGILPLLYKAERASKWIRDLNNRIYFGINFGRIQVLFVIWTTDQHLNRLMASTLIPGYPVYRNDIVWLCFVRPQDTVIILTASKRGIGVKDQMKIITIDTNTFYGDNYCIC